MSLRSVWIAIVGVVCLARVSSAQSASLSGVVRAETAAALPGVSVELRNDVGSTTLATTDAGGAYRFTHLAPGRYTAAFTLLNFATVRREVTIADSPVNLEIVLHLALNADVTVIGKRMFTNLADVEHPEENLVGIAQASSQGAITSKQLDERPLMREGEVLETVPGVIVTQHSGEGKANQYFLRGFNLDHGTDFATTVVGIPVNMPTHAHGQGYSDLNFLIPELVTGVQFSKGPYYADQGDFATAGSSNINYATRLDRPILYAAAGQEGYGRVLAAASPQLGSGHLVAALEMAHNDGPWDHPDDFQKVNGVLRYSQGDIINGWAITAMGYHGRWNSTDQVAQRAITSGRIDRFGAIDPSDGGHTYRSSASIDWQHGSAQTITKATAYALMYDLDLFSNFTYDLIDPVHGDQIEQADRRFVSGGKVTHRRVGRWAGHEMQNIVGIQVRNDDIRNIALYHTEARARLDTRTQDAVVETTGGLFAQNEVQWRPWLRTLAGIRLDASRFHVDDQIAATNSGTVTAALVSPKGGVTVGPWKGTEFYVNGGTGFHSNDARGTTITRDADGNPADRVTSLVRARGAEVGVRTVAVRHLQSTFTFWTLHLDSELVFSGDDGTTVPSRPSTRRGVEWANYYSPAKWLVFDGDVSRSRARFTEFDPVGQYVPEAVGTVVSAGATVDTYRRTFGSLRWRYFGPRSLVENNSVHSRATSLLNLQGGYRVAQNAKVVLDVFNLLNASDSDIDYFYTSRLPGETVDGIDDIHTHPTLPRTARLGLMIGF
jgi:TonB-dependent receptor-like protein/carboxypeptidase family protein